MKRGTPRLEKAAAYGTVASRARAALAAGATTPRQIVAMYPGISLDSAGRACLDMTLSGVVTRDDCGHFHATEHIMSEEAFRRYQAEIRREAALTRRPPEPDHAAARAVNAALVAWRCPGAA